MIVTGCAANLNAAQFDEIGPSVTALVGTADDVAEEVAGAAGPGCVDTALDPLPLQGIAATRTRGFVKVQDGCDCRCAYCIIPLVRGGARSRPASAVLDEARRRAEQGQPEMVMTGISVGDYRDPERGLELGELMREVAAVEGVERVRLSSVEVIHVQRLAASPRSPRTSGSARTSTSRSSPATTACSPRWAATTTPPAISTRSSACASACPHVNLTTDAIVGYPTEDERGLRAHALDRARRRASPRSTRSAFRRVRARRPTALGDPVPPAEKKRRSRELRGLSEVLGRRHRAAKLGAVEEVLVDKRPETQVAGYSRDYTRYYLPPERRRPVRSSPRAP